MTLEISETWGARLSPQANTDLIIQIYPLESGKEIPDSECAFHLGELLRTELEDHCTIMGAFAGTSDQHAIISRWADQLEIFARQIRVALSVRVSAEEQAKIDAE